MKSAGEQSAGHTFLHGFSSQYSHFLISDFNWASVKNMFLITITSLLKISKFDPARSNKVFGRLGYPQRNTHGLFILKDEKEILLPYPQLKCAWFSVPESMKAKVSYIEKYFLLSLKGFLKSDLFNIN